MIEAPKASQPLNPNSASLFDPQRRGLSIGLILVITMIAFEALGIATVAPAISESLNGLQYYGLMFSAFLIAELFGASLAGDQADRFGLSYPISVGMIVFAVGLLISGFAPTMLIMVLGRIAQGFGSGLLVTSNYVCVSLGYSGPLRSKMLALMSSAWVTPAFVGPLLASFITEHGSWRIIFLGLVPLCALAAYLILRPVRHFKAQDSGKKVSALPALRLSLGASLLLISFNSQHWLLILATALSGFWLLLWAVKDFMPPGVLWAKRGIAALIASRGLFSSSFIAAEAFLSLFISKLLGYTSFVTAMFIAIGALTWTLGSFLQSRLDSRDGGKHRHHRVIIGTAIMLISLSLLPLKVIFTDLSNIVIFAAWMLAGLGIGLAHASSSVITLDHAKKGEEGKMSAALQLADLLIASIATGIGGMFIALADRGLISFHQGLLAAFGFCLLIILLGFISALRVGDLNH
ncbi:MAG: MFS transporter [Deinococcales bacterium]